VNRRIFFADFTGLGSACLAVPVLRSLEQANAGVRYSYPANPVLGDPYIREASGLGGLIALTDPGWRRWARADWPAIASFMDEHAIDTVINFRNPDLAVEPAYAGFRAWFTRGHPAMDWNDLYDGRRLEGIHVRQRMLEVVLDAGFRLAPLETGWLADAAREVPQARKPAGGDALIGLFVSASVPSKRWPLEYWLDLISRLSEKTGAELEIFSGTSGAERDMSQQLMERLTEIRRVTRVHLVPPCGVGVLAARLARLSALVANDTGVGHLAAACGTPTISLFLSTDPDVWAVSPGAPNLRSRIGSRCPAQRPAQGNCTHHYAACDAPCHWDVLPDQVVEAVLPLLRGRPHALPATRVHNQEVRWPSRSSL
jgi:ADP-heptose:LPS heptosyltransferase